MPVIATYRHRLVLLQGVADIGARGDVHWLVCAGRSQLYHWIHRGETRESFLAHLMPKHPDAFIDFFAPEHSEDLELDRWNATAGDYPPGSPYDLPRPLPTKEE